MPPNTLWGHRLARKFAFVHAGAALVIATLLALVVPGIPFWTVPVWAIIVGTFSHVVAHRLLARHIERIHQSLEDFRAHRFESLDEMRETDDDELGVLIQEVQQTGASIRKDIASLKKVESYRREFLGNVSHELKTPIFSIKGFAETLRDGALEDTRVNHRFLQKIINNADRLSNLAGDLSEISKIETGELRMRKAPFNLKKAAIEVIGSLQPIAEARQMTVTCRMPDNLPHAVGDEERLKQVLVNLIENAIKYNDPGGYVDVVARLLSNGDLKVSIVDDGIGIEDVDIPRITERFYRVDKSRSRSQGGTGLGLAIVKHILGAHERTLMVNSLPDRGSTFGFTLPTMAEATAIDPNRPTTGVATSLS